MTTQPVPDKGTTSRELLSQARRIERYGVQRRKLLAKVEELDGRIREAKRLFRQLTELIAQPELAVVAGALECWCNAATEAHKFGDELLCVASRGVRL